MKITFYVTGQDYSGNYVAFSKLLTGKVDGLKDIEITRRRKPENASNGGFSSEMTFYGDGYDIIKEFLIDAENGRTAYIDVTINDSCCLSAKPIYGIIRGDEIEWYEGRCYVRATVKENSLRTQALACLDSTMIWDNTYGFKSDTHPRIDYFTGVNELLYVITVLFDVLQVILFPIIAIISYLRGIINKIHKFFGGTLKDPGNANLDDLFKDYLKWMQDIHQMRSGTGRVHPAPFARDYIKNACKKCGLTFQSTILNNPQSLYYNTAYLYAPSQKGVKDDSSIYWIEDNRPLLSATNFLNEIKQAHNAEWIVANGKLIYERKDKIEAQNDSINYSLLGERVIDIILYEWAKHETPASVTFTYSEDFSDELGNEARTKYFTLDRNYNAPTSPMRSGYKTYALPFGAPAFKESDNEILSLANHLSSMPKLLLLKNDYRAKAKVLNGNRAYRFIPDEGNNIYADFFHIEDTRNSNAIKYNFSFSFRYECDELAMFDTLATVTLPIGTGEIEEITFKPNERTMTIKGRV